MGFVPHALVDPPPARPYEPLRLIVDRDVRLDGDELVYPVGIEPAVEEPPPDLLDRFVALAEAPDVGILVFARRFGVLQTCRHGLPYRHDPKCKLRPVRHPAAEHAFYYREPLAAWRRLAAQVRAVLRIATAVERDTLGSAGDWAVVWPETQGRDDVLDEGRAEWLATIDGQRYSLVSVVSAFLWVGDVRPRLVCECVKGRGTRVTFALGANRVFGEVALRLAMTVSRVEGLAICANCKTPYTPKRRPKRGQRSFCPNCGKKAAQRFASRDYRCRQRAKRES